MNGVDRRRLAVATATMLATTALVAGLAPGFSAGSLAGTPSKAAAEKALVVGAKEAAPLSTLRPRGLVDRPTHGLVYQGLGRSAQCEGGFRLEGSHRVCTHGPDSAGEAAGTLEAGGSSSTSGQIPCYGDGVSGSRVQMVYAAANDRPDRYSSLLDTFPVYAARMNSVFANSAANYGVTRNLRFVHTADCRLDVLHVVLSPSGDDTFSATVTELQNLGLTRTDRKYLVWVDASVYCGIGSVVQDESSGSGNRANFGPTFARVDAPCWGAYNSVEAHEISHTLGAVQLGSPNSNGAWHCTDESDRMCYDDGSGATMHTVCPSGAEGFLDCGGDDYFNPSPSQGSYLATHWNLADSVFLSSQPPGSAEIGPTTAPTSTPSATSTPSVSPTPTSCSTNTANYSGSLNKKQLARDFPIAAIAGPFQADMTVSKGKSMRLTLFDQTGSSIASSTSMSTVHVAVDALASGPYLLRVDGNNSGSFALAVKYCA